MSDCPHDYDEREASVYADGLCPICLRAEVLKVSAENQQLSSLADSLGEDAQRYLSHLTHAAGFIEGMAARLERWRPIAEDQAIEAAAEELRVYARSLRQLTGIVLAEDATADPSQPGL